MILTASDTVRPDEHAARFCVWVFADFLFPCRDGVCDLLLSLLRIEHRQRRRAYVASPSDLLLA